MAGKVCLACISETVRCRMTCNVAGSRYGHQKRCSQTLYLVGTLVRGCRCATSWCDLDLTFDLAVVTLTYKILSGLYLGNCKV